MNPLRLPQLFRDKNIIIVLGAGGVGKTTTSIALATAAAMTGKKVGLLSIDPAKRLAAALGIPLGSELREIHFADPKMRGQLYASMLDQKAVFDHMVQKHAPSAQIAKRIMEHPLYIAASSNLAGPLEYMALAKLQEMVETGHYDLIVVDTPPDAHALDFLARPNVLSGFMENKVMSWLIKPFHLAEKFGLGRFLAVGEKMLGGLTKVTGVKAFKSFAEFLLLIQEIIDGFHRAGTKTQEILKMTSTSFAIVSLPRSGSIRSTEHICNELNELGYHLDLAVFNRCLPSFVREEFNDPKGIYHHQVLKHEKDLLFARIDQENRLIGALESDLRSKVAGLITLRVDEKEYPLHDSAAILRMAQELSTGP